jgi:hypothetical protein
VIDMTHGRRIGLVFRVAAATAWSLVLGLVGLWCCLHASARWPMFAGVWTLGGVAALGAASFVFMVLVSDRLFPGASRRLVISAELAAIMVFVGGLGAMLWEFSHGT